MAVERKLATFREIVAVALSYGGIAQALSPTLSGLDPKVPLGVSAHLRQRHSLASW
jgi:hypothetical protein